jgi:hypothetical protein
MPPNQPGPQKEPVHKFCERINIVQTKDLFLFGMHSGGEVSAFVLTPDHAKQLLRLLQKNVADYEAAHGVLEGRLPSDPTLSPIQKPQ